MRITHTGGRTVIELDPAEKRDLRADLDRASWSELSAAGRELFHHLAAGAAVQAPSTLQPLSDYDDGLGPVWPQAS